MEFHHVPVLLEPCLEALAIDPDGIYVDGTAGGAGHSAEIAKRLRSGRLIAIDKDEAAVRAARERLAPYPQATVIRRDFREIPAVLDELGIGRVQGILLDLGVSSHQLDTPERGFSYRHDAPLDMRMSGAGTSARDLVNGLDVPELARIFRRYGEERYALSIAKSIERARKNAPIESTGRLVDIIKASVPAAARREGHPAKRVFQALRIAVNGELDALGECLDRSFEWLSVGGRFAVITFHSLEDRIVKQRFAGFAAGCTCPSDFPVCVCGRTPRAKTIGKKPIIPSPQEMEHNPRSKSAKLRVLEKIEDA